MIDTHCHLFLEYYPDLSNVLNKMQNNIMIVAGTNQKTNKEVIDMCKNYNNIYGVIGIHPEDIDEYKEEDLKFIEKNLNNPKIVGIGEIGLDYHFKDDNKDEQQKLFIKQILLAEKYHKTLIIHSRDAINDTYQILSKYGLDLKKVLHCYSSSYEMAEKFIKMNCMLGIGGVLTFKNSQKLKEVVEKIDLKYLLLETDSPFLTPEPFRGQKNEPYNIIYIAQKISEIKKIPVENVVKSTTLNATNQFDLKVNL